jgi:hypothetical protein
MTSKAARREPMVRFEICHYEDTGQTVARAVWADQTVTQGSPKNEHMIAFWDRAVRENLPVDVFGFPNSY